MEQLSIFDLDHNLTTFHIDPRKPIRLISLFSGYDSQKLAFNYLKIDVEHYRAVEFDKYAIQSLNDIHNTNFSTIDITKIEGIDLGIIETNKYTYVMTYSFPCQDLSLAGKRAGMEKGSQTRSGLLWEVERLLNEVDNLPQVLIMENVLQVLSANGWREWVAFLESKGYSNYAEVLNAKNYGIPQNRERCFMVSILGKYNYKFPKGFELKYRLKDLLESNVDESYYLSDKFLKYCFGVNQKESKFPRKKRFLQSLQMTNGKDIATTISTNTGNRPVDNFIIIDYKSSPADVLEIKPNVIGRYVKGGFSAGQIVDKESIAPTFMEHHGQVMGVVEEKIIIPEATKQGFSVAGDGDGVYINRPHQKRGVVQKGMIQTLKTSCADVGVVANKNNQLIIRKLTPLEVFKLMGVKPSDYEKLTVSKSQKYKQAGNSIVTTCLMAIYSQLFNDIDYKQRIEELLEELIEK